VLGLLELAELADEPRLPLCWPLPACWLAL
jgi:hypothetical protein